MKTEFYNTELEQVYKLAKENGLKVYTFKGSTPKRYIKQIFITDGINIGSCSAYFSGVRFSTEHKPNKQCGTGFILQSDHIVNSTIENINRSLKTTAPIWGAAYLDSVKKYKDWSEYLQKNTILTYYEI